MSISKIIILPTYNEEDNLEKLIEIFKRDFPDFFLLVVDDSPNNLTKETFDKSNYQKSKIIVRGKKLGRGSAVRRGFEFAIENNCSLIVEMDTDFSHDPKDLKRIIQYFQQSDNDIVIGSRYLKDSKIVNWELQRRIFSRLANFLARLLFNFSIKDYTNGFRVYNYKTVKKITSYPLINSGFIYLTETLVIAFKNNFKCSELPITFVNRTRGQSSVNLKGVFDSFIGILKIKLNSKNL
tara:strand:- start:163 stop:876 length:714 start_codon:yes stop_codon:yes gene_type:complete